MYYSRYFIRCLRSFHSSKSRNLNSNIVISQSSRNNYINNLLKQPCLLCGQLSWARDYGSKRYQKAAKKEQELKPLKKLKEKAKMINVWQNMTVRELARAADRDIDDVFEAMIYLDHCDDYDRPSSAIFSVNALYGIVKKLGLRCCMINDPKIQIIAKESKDIKRRPSAKPSELVKRPPVVAIMGHVDHGKTTLLDSLRNTSVVKQEFGGITQHIGAFSVVVPSGDRICFLDTPGHAAFSAMRARGANATDIVVLVVAADDGVMEQTIESIKYAKAANVSIIVAVNKMDKPGVDPERVKQGLVMHGVFVEEKGGDVQAVHISARNGQNLDALVEAILTLSEMIDVKADPKGMVEGVIIESTQHPGRGKLATVLIQRGTLSKGKYLVAGTAWAKVRAMFDEKGQQLTSVTPGYPVQVIGWRELPSAGDIVLEVETEHHAVDVQNIRLEAEREKKMEESVAIIKQKEEEHLSVYKPKLKERRDGGWKTYRHIGGNTLSSIQTDETTPRLHVIIKGDVDGSVEAILNILDTYKSQTKCRLELLHFGVGNVNLYDMEIAETFDGFVYAFNVGVSQEVTQQTATSKILPIKHFNVIYKLIDDLKDEINSRLIPEDKEDIIGEANVLQEFKATRGKGKVPVAGCRCTKGHLQKSALFKVFRKEQVVHQGTVHSMFHLKNQVDSIKKDVECGIMFENSEVHFEPGDTILCYRMVKETQQTDWDPGF